MKFLRYCFIALLSAGPAAKAATPGLMGPLGLNIVPSARMDDPGTVRATFTTLDPYIHGHAGIQIAEPLYIGLRQSALTSSLRGDADGLAPGMDVKLRLLKETSRRPQLVIGMQSVTGMSRMGAEYIVASKRWNDFDFTGGAGWFNGDFGVFGGVEYFTPWVEGLSLKADWSAEDYEEEEAAIAGYDAPASWSLGFAWQPVKWASLGMALAGGEKIMGGISFQGPLGGWPRRMASLPESLPVSAARQASSATDQMEETARSQKAILYDTQTIDKTVQARLAVSPHLPLPPQIGRAARAMTAHAGPEAEEFRIIPTSGALEGREVRLVRHDLERTLGLNQGSPQEIWRNVVIEPAAGDEKKRGFLRPLAPVFSLILDNQISLSEHDQGLLYRTGIVAEERISLTRHFLAGAGLRLDVKDNLDKLNDLRAPVSSPTRGDIDRFAKQTVSVERLYAGWMHSFNPDLHASLTGGMLEEMYAGFGGEVLYRPYGRTFAVGVDAWQVYKRDPGSRLNLDIDGDGVFTGHVNAWYEIPGSDLTVQLRAGRYLGEDFGGSLSLDRRFNNGVKAKAFITATNDADFDIFGGTTHLYSGLQLILPFGDMKLVPDGTALRVTAAPLGRNAGQALDAPVPLYEFSEPLSARHISRHWTGITD